MPSLTRLVGPTVLAALLMGTASPAEAQRPKIAIAVGMGASLDSAGLTPGRTEAIPSFFAVGGFGDGLFGLDFGLFASTAAGRYPTPDQPIDRLGIDVMGVIRPLASLYSGAELSYAQAMLRTLAAELGGGYEHDSRGLQSGGRTGLRVGGRIDVPLFRQEPGQLRVRFAVRRFFGLFVPRLPPTDVGDTSLEAYGALVLSF